MRTPSLPNDDPDPEARAASLARAREAYAFRYDYHDIVAAVSLPMREKSDARYWAAILEAGAALEVNKLASETKGLDAKGLLEKVRARISKKVTETFAPEEYARQRHAEAKAASAGAQIDYERMYATIAAPPIVQCWELDDVFAWQALAGANPVMLRRMAGVPDHFALRDAHCRATGCGSLEAAIAEGRAYLADYAALEGLPEGEIDGLRKLNFAPIAAYVWSPERQRLVAIAIQCGQSPSSGIYGPADGIRWRMARTCVTTAEGNYQGILSHFALCHQVMESVILSARRQLAETHPLLVLLAPHFENTLITNDIARTGLIGPGGYMERLQSPTLEASLALATREIDAFVLTESAPRKDFAARGVEDREALPEYPFRDDGLLVWDAIVPFIESYLRLYYPSDDAVRADPELEAWAHEMGSRSGGRLRGITRPETFAQLSDLIAQILFRCTAHHAAINYSSFDLFGYPPNMQPAAYGPGPSGTSDTEAAWRAMLPPYHQAEQAFRLFYEITIQLNRIGEYPPHHFADPRVAPLLDEQRARLEEVERTIDARDQTRLLSYPYQRPSRISRSIHV